MDQPQRKPTGVPLEIAIRGEEATVARLLATMAAALGEGLPPAASAAPLLLTREQAMERTGWTSNRISALIKAERLTNHGSGRKLLISPREVGDLIRESR